MPPPPPMGGAGAPAPGGPTKPVEVEAGDVWDALEKALNKLEGKTPPADDKSGDGGDQPPAEDEQAAPPPETEPAPNG